MSDVSEIWMQENEDEARGIERLVRAAAKRAAELESDPLLNGRKQSVTALRNHLLKLAEDAAQLRRAFRPTPAEPEESVDEELAEAVIARRNGASAQVKSA